MELDIKVSQKVDLTIGFENGATVEVKAVTPALSPEDLEIRAQALADVFSKAIKNFVRPVGESYQPVEKLV